MYLRSERAVATPRIAACIRRSYGEREARVGTLTPGSRGEQKARVGRRERSLPTAASVSGRRRRARRRRARRRGRRGPVVAPATCASSPWRPSSDDRRPAAARRPRSPAAAAAALRRAGRRPLRVGDQDGEPVPAHVAPRRRRTSHRCRRTAPRAAPSAPLPAPGRSRSSSREVGRERREDLAAGCSRRSMPAASIAVCRALCAPGSSPPRRGSRGGRRAA